MSDNPISLTRVSLFGRCPRCGVGKLFNTFLAMHTHCPQCNLHFAAREQGDGATFFAITFIGALVTILAVWIEIVYEPPFWLHAVLWFPFIVIGSLVALRIAKAWMLGLQYSWKPYDFE